MQENGSPSEVDGDGIPKPLWTRKDVAAYLRVSDRWVDKAMTRKAEEHGSMPHVELPTQGAKRFIRFVPEMIRRWAAMGFPPVADFEEMTVGTSPCRVSTRR